MAKINKEVLSKQHKILRSKLKRDCIYYIIAAHGIRCCVKAEPTVFDRLDQCVGCKDYVSSNKERG